MKKVLLILSLLLIMVLLTGCKTTDIYGQERHINHGLIEINRIEGNGYSSIVYDSTTRICYLCIEANLGGLSPYYILDDEGNPELAIYGVNYMPKP